MQNERFKRNDVVFLIWLCLYFVSLFFLFVAGILSEEGVIIQPSNHDKWVLFVAIGIIHVTHVVVAYYCVRWIFRKLKQAFITFLSYVFTSDR